MPVLNSYTETNTEAYTNANTDTITDTEAYRYTDIDIDIETGFFYTAHAYFHRPIRESKSKHWGTTKSLKIGFQENFKIGQTLPTKLQNTMLNNRTSFLE